MLKRPILIFLAVIAILVTGVVGFVQSAQFASLLKRVVTRYFPKDVGIEADFSDLSVGLFPPLVSVRNPRVIADHKNIAGLPPGTRVSAERIDLSFGAVQMLSGEIRIDRVRVIKGQVELALGAEDAPRPKAPRARIALRWEDLLKVKADSFSFEETQVRLHLVKQDVHASLIADAADISPWIDLKSGPGYQLRVGLRQIEVTSPKGMKLPVQKLDRFSADLQVNAREARFQSLELEEPGLKVQLNGRILGDILAPKDLPLEADARIEGDLSRFREWLLPASKLSLEGSGIFRGKLKGDATRFQETVRADGALQVRNLRAGHFQADELNFQGAWSASDGGELSVTKAEISASQAPRIGGSSSGKGGSLKLGAFRFKPSSVEPISVPIELENAHIHWLAAVALKEVWPLDFRLSGKMNATYVPGGRKGAWSSEVKLDLRVERFRLDNQRMGLTRPLRTILEIPEVRLRGPLLIDSRSVRPEGLVVSAGSTQFTCGGKIDFQSGWDLLAKGPANLQDVGKIADNEITGQGSLAIHVHGRPENVFVDFDSDLKDASYLKLKFGAFQGRITYADDASQLLFTGIQAKKGRTAYGLEGMIDLQKDSVSLDAAFKPGSRLEDLIDLFSNLTRKVSWFPSTLAGSFEGPLKVRGGLSLETLKARAVLEGTNWEWIGEKFLRAKIVGGYDSGRYSVEEFTGSKPVGRLVGKISYGPEPYLDWDLRSEDFLIHDFDRVARLDVPVRGRLSVVSRGKGRMGAIEASTRIQVSELSVRGVAYASSELLIRSRDGMTDVQGSGLGGQATLQAMLDSRPGKLSTVRGELRNLDFTPQLLLFNPKAIQDRQLEGRISGSIDLQYPANEPEKLTGKLTLEDYVLAKSGARFVLKQPVGAQFDRGSFDVPSVIIAGEAGEAKLSLRAREGSLNGKIDGKLDASIAEFFTSSIAKAEGAAELDFQLGGRLFSPEIGGRARLSDVILRLSALESPFENVSGTILLRQGTLSFVDMESDLAGGRATLGGIIELFPDRYPELKLNGSVQGSRLKVFPFQFVKVRGKLSARGIAPPYQVDGSVVVETALSREKVLNRAQTLGVKSARYTPQPGSAREGDVPLFKLDIDVKGEKGILVQNDLFDAELKTQVKLVNTLDAPRIVGTAEVIQGKLTFKDRSFQMSSAQLNFDNPNAINPLFNMTASTDVSGTKIQLYAAGRMDNYKIDLTSNPALPEPEIISLLALGATSEDVKRLRAGDKSSYEQGEAASLLLHSLDFNRDVQAKTGFEIQLDESVGTQQGTSVFRPRTEADSASAPKLVIKRRIGKKFDVSVGSTVGVGTNNQKQVNLEYHVTPAFSINGVWDTLEALEAKEPLTSYGVDFKLQKRFK